MGATDLICVPFLLDRPRCNGDTSKPFEQLMCVEEIKHQLREARGQGEACVCGGGGWAEPRQDLPGQMSQANLLGIIPYILL